MIDQANPRQQILIGLALAGLMAATRGQFFAPIAHHLPDASLAVFALAGFYLRGSGSFIGLLVLATLIDLTAIGWGGVSGFCLTPAYGLLLPTYALLWGTGRWIAGRLAAGTISPPLIAATLFGAGVVAELIASGGFYLFSGRFGDLSAERLLLHLATYLPDTLLALGAYTAMAVLTHLGLDAWVAAKDGRR